MAQTRIRKEVSTPAKIGKILILISIILDAIALVALALVAVGAIDISEEYLPEIIPLASGLLVFLLLFVIAGFVLGILAYRAAAYHGDYNSAGIYALIASFLPPIDIVMLVGAVLCFSSREARR